MADQPGFSVDSVKRKFEAVGRELVDARLVDGFSIEVHDGIKFTAKGVSEALTASVAMTPTTEVFFLDLGTAYHLTQTAYDTPAKTSALDEFLEYLRLFVARRYSEELEEQGGRPLSRTIHLDGPDGPVSISSPGKLSWLRRRLKATSIRTVRPDRA